MFRAAHRLSLGALNCIFSRWFTYICGDWPLSRLSGIFPLSLDNGRSPRMYIYVTRGCKYSLKHLMMNGMPLETCWAFSKLYE